MGLLDAPLRAVARQLTGTFGERVVLVLDRTEEYDPSTGMTADPAPSTVAVSAVREPYKARFAADAPELAEGAEFTLTVPAEGLDDTFPLRAPGVRDTVIVDATITGADTDPTYVGGETFRILHVDVVKSGEQVALYRLHVRR